MYKWFTLYRLQSNLQILKTKWRGICKAYRNPILESNVGQMFFENKGKTYKAHVISTTRGGRA
jgi:hypothetical protein